MLSQRGPEGTTPLVRMASHLVIVLVAILVLLFTRLELPRWDIAQAQRAQSPAQQTESATSSEAVAAAGEATLVRAAVPFTLIPDRPRIEIITHTVEAGDTLYAIADKYNISAETLMWANNMELNPDLLRLGQELTVLPVNGVYHSVEKNDTVESIAKKYKVAPADILSFPLNGLNAKNPSIQVGQKLIVPGGTKPAVVRQVQVYTGAIPAKASHGTGRFVWPTSGSISQAFKPLHQAIDIGSYTGAPVKASDSGYVVASGWSNVGYGNYVVIDHGNGFQTLYGHLSRILVNAGESVAQGTVIGLVGSTGNSTGPHLHFELHQSGVPRNPFGFLP
jgi:murein DD-endopeptidase MepM/ murein hydrolase activator NlpD